MITSNFNTLIPGLLCLLILLGFFLYQFIRWKQEINHHNNQGTFNFILKRELPSLSVLTATNLIPIAGVFYFNWTVLEIIFLYFIENIIIGLYTLLKLCVHTNSSWDEKLYEVLKHIVGYGLFLFLHGSFLYSLYDKGESSTLLFMFGLFIILIVYGFLFLEEENIDFTSTSLDAVEAVLGSFNFFIKVVYICIFLFGFLYLFHISLTNWSLTSIGLIIEVINAYYLWVPVLFLFISHGFSFYKNFIVNKESDYIGIDKLRKSIYPRIFVMTMVILFSGTTFYYLKGQELSMIMLVILKILFDIYAHWREHSYIPYKDLVMIINQK